MRGGGSLLFNFFLNGSVVGGDSPLSAAGVVIAFSSSCSSSFNLSFCAFSRNHCQYTNTPIKHTPMTKVAIISSFVGGTRLDVSA